MATSSTFRIPKATITGLYGRAQSAATAATVGCSRRRRPPALPPLQTVTNVRSVS